jgi:hypothetical protein
MGRAGRQNCENFDFLGVRWAAEIVKVAKRLRLGALDRRYRHFSVPPSVYAVSFTIFFATRGFSTDSRRILILSVDGRRYCPPLA